MVDYIYKDLDGFAKGYDIDNLQKATFDNLQRRHVIENDSQIYGVIAFKIKGPDDHTTIRIYETKGKLRLIIDNLKNKILSLLE